MRPTRNLLALIGALALAIPTPAAIKAMTLRELMQVTHDVIDGQIVAKSTFRVAHPDYEGQVFTRVTIVGESLRTGEAVEEQLVYTGSHDPADQYVSSEMPQMQDVRLGTRVVAFYGIDEANRSGAKQVWGFNCVFRVESVFGEPVVIGKGEGFAFRENEKLVDARARVRSIHTELVAAQAAELQK